MLVFPKRILYNPLRDRDLIRVIMPALDYEGIIYHPRDISGMSNNNLENFTQLRYTGVAHIFLHVARGGHTCQL